MLKHLAALHKQCHRILWDVGNFYRFVCSWQIISAFHSNVELRGLLCVKRSNTVLQTIKWLLPFSPFLHWRFNPWCYLRPYYDLDLEGYYPLSARLEVLFEKNLRERAKFTKWIWVHWAHGQSPNQWNGWAQRNHYTHEKYELIIFKWCLSPKKSCWEQFSLFMQKSEIWLEVEYV